MELDNCNLPSTLTRHKICKLFRSTWQHTEFVRSGEAGILKNNTGSRRAEPVAVD
jgi:hypothetical protein